MSNERAYSEREVVDIIERAVERQEAERRNESGEGLTISELERLGEDVGIDSAHLRAAAVELDSVGRTLSKQSSTTKTTIETERWIDAPLTLEVWEDAVEEMQQRYGPNAYSILGQSVGGTVNQIGSSFEWTHTNGFGIQTRMSASERGGRTRLRLSQVVGSASPKIEGLMYGGLGALIVGIISMVVAKEAFAVGKPDIFLVFLLSSLVSMFVLAPLTTALDRRWRDKKHRALESVANDLVPVFGRAAKESAAPEIRVARGQPNAEIVALAPELSFDEAIEASPGTSSSNRNRTRS